MMRILLLGKIGQLGWECSRTLTCLGDVVSFDYPEVDFTNPDMLKGIVSEIKPQVIINAVAYTDVDKAEKEADKARLLNSIAPAILAESARKIHSAFIHFSTDFVYNGTKGTPYVEEDAPDPLNLYGITKLDGDRAIMEIDDAYIILRTSWVYSMRRGSIVTKVLSWARSQETLRVVSDQVRNPTWSRMLAEITASMLAKGAGDIYSWVKERSGLYHLGGDGRTSMYDWAKAIIELDPHRSEQVCRNIVPVGTSEFPTPAKRPLMTALDCAKFYQRFNLCLPHWKTALELAMGE